MDLLTKIKDKGQEHVVEGIFALVLLLLGVIWAAVPSEVWGRVSGVTPKRVLWAAIGLLVLGLFLETAYVAHLRRKLKLKPRFGVLWNRELVPHCPSCSSLLTGYGQYSTAYGFGNIWAFKCVKCDELIKMTDDEGSIVELKEAKRVLATKAALEKPEPDADEMRILTLLSKAETSADACGLRGRSARSD